MLEVESSSLVSSTSLWSPSMCAVKQYNLQQYSTCFINTGNMSKSTDTSHKTSLSESLMREAEADYHERLANQQKQQKDELAAEMERQQRKQIEAAQREALKKEA
ncbi:hypothetical protein CC79DRAFT_1369208 [Sarocladium strictum]